MANCEAFMKLLDGDMENGKADCQLDIKAERLTWTNQRTIFPRRLMISIAPYGVMA